MTADLDARRESAADGAADQGGDFFGGLLRAFGGALLFSLPLLMTMEMWSFGLYLSPARLALFSVVGLAFVVGLVKTIGFKREEEVSVSKAIVDAGVAYLVGAVTAATVLWLFSVIDAQSGPRLVLSVVALETLPASMGAAFARGFLGGDVSFGSQRETYGHELFLMAAGAMAFAFNIAPTEEIVLLSYKMTARELAVLATMSIALLHGLVFAMGFPGSAPHNAKGRDFLRFTLAGYATVLALAAFVLWTFGRFEGLGAGQVLGAIVVLGFPGVLGAGAARLVL